MRVSNIIQATGMTVMVGVVLCRAPEMPHPILYVAGVVFGFVIGLLVGSPKDRVR